MVRSTGSTGSGNTFPIRLGHRPFIVRVILRFIRRLRRLIRLLPLLPLYRDVAFRFRPITGSGV